MADIQQIRKNIQEKETDYKAIVSSATIKKIGAGINFINNSQTMSHDWKLNRFYSFGRNIVNLDGHLTNPFAWEIVAFSFVHGTAGISGTTTFQIQWRPANDTAAAANILSSAISFGTSLPSNRHYMLRLTDDVEVSGSGLITKPIFTKKTFFAGDRLQLNLTSAMNGAQDLAIKLHWRPINDSDVT